MRIRTRALASLAVSALLAGSLAVATVDSIKVSRAHASTSLLTLTDVSPDAGPNNPARTGYVCTPPQTVPSGYSAGDFCSTGTNPGGRIVEVAVDPLNDNIVWAASKQAGVWKSFDGGIHWFQSGNGLKTGITVHTEGGSGGHSMDVDHPANASPRLLYATEDTDGRPAANSQGGLWVSTNGGSSWRRPYLPTRSAGDPPCIGVYDPTFSSGYAYVLTSCGIEASTDLALNKWSLITTPLPFAPSSLTSQLGYENFGNTLFACGPDPGAPNSFFDVWRIQDPSADILNPKASSWQKWPGGGIPGTCENLDVGPVPAAEPATALVLSNRCNPVTGNCYPYVSEVDYASTQITDLQFNVTGCQTGSGRFAISTPRIASAPANASGPGSAYDVFASDNGCFSEFYPAAPGSFSGSWIPAGNTHTDSWAMAFPSSYDPPNGHCVGYIASDGGLYESDAPSTPGCAVNSQPWMEEMSGLHAIQAEQIAGFDAQSNVPGGTALFVPTTDNGTFFSPIHTPPFSPASCSYCFGNGPDGNIWLQFLSGNLGIGDTALTRVDPFAASRVVEGGKSVILGLATNDSGNVCNVFGQNCIPAPPPAFDTEPLTVPNSPDKNGAVTIPNSPGGSPGGGNGTPDDLNFSQVMWLPTDNTNNWFPSRNGYEGDYFEVQRPSQYPTCCNNSSDGIVRNITAISSGQSGSSSGGWFAVSPPPPIPMPTNANGSSACSINSAGVANVGGSLPCGNIRGLVTAGGHTNTIVYALGQDGSVWRSTVNGPANSTAFTAWVRRTGQVGTTLGPHGISSIPVKDAINLYTDPYNGQLLYTTDRTSSGVYAIKTSSDGGQNWFERTDLENIATNNGEFQLKCGTPGANGDGGSKFWDGLCSLQEVVFDPVDANLQVAVLPPGGLAISRDSGAHWIPLLGGSANNTAILQSGLLQNEPTTLPSSAYLDDPCSSCSKRLFVGLHGRGVMQIDGNLVTLTALEASITGLSAQSQASFVNDTTGNVTQLRRAPDGSFKGTELIDDTATKSFSYHFVVNGTASQTIKHSLSGPEISSGVVQLTEPAPAADWTQFQGGAAHAGLQPNETILNTGNVNNVQLKQAWALTGLGFGHFASSPVVQGNAIYIEDENGNLEKFVANSSSPSTSTSGSLQWATQTGAAFSAPAIYSDPTNNKTYVYTASLAGRVTRVDAQGGVPYPQVASQSEDIIGAPTVADGKVFVISGTGDLRAYDPYLNKIWQVQVDDPATAFTWGSPTVVGGVVYEPTENGRLYGFDELTGVAESWSPLTLDPNVREQAPTTAASDGSKLYISADAGSAVGRDDGTGQLIAVDLSTHSVAWKVDLGQSIGEMSGEASNIGAVPFDEPSPAVDGTTVVVGASLHVFAFDTSTHKEVWSTPTFCCFPTSPVIANGVVYMGGLFGSSGQLVAYREDSGLQIFYKTFPTPMNTTPAVANGVVYIGGGNGSPSNTSQDVFYAYHL